MVTTPLDDPSVKPDDLIDYPCKICGGTLPRVTHHWIATTQQWMHPAVHDRCATAWEKQKAAPKTTKHAVPERFAHFDATRANAEAVRLCGEFSPESKVKTLALIGGPGKGKSRLLWATVAGFFAELGHGWVEHFEFENLMAEYDKADLVKVTQSRYVLVDDIGSIDCYGRERAGLQAALRSRIKSNERWTFLTIDRLENFDPDLGRILKDRAISMLIE
jgi:chromosomal replication initiation ATPase DnaA